MNGALRLMLTVIGVSEAHLYRCQDLRRGHADDLRANGATLNEILLAGDWKSAAFKKYHIYAPTKNPNRQSNKYIHT